MASTSSLVILLMPRIAKTYLLTAREARALLGARRHLALLLFSLALGLGGASLLLTPPLQESSMKILVHQERSTPEQIAAAITSESELLQSQPVIGAAAAELHLADASTLAARLSVLAGNGSHFITVSYQDQSPQQAAQVLHTLFRHYAAQRERLRPTVPVDAILRERSVAFNQKLDEATDALKRLAPEGGLQADAAQHLLKQFYEVQKQAEAARLEKREVEQQLTTLRAQLATQPEQIEISSQTKYAQALDKMKEELVALELQRTQLLQKYQPNHRLLRDADQRLGQVKELIAREEQNPPRERAFARNETRARLSEARFQAETQLAALAEREQRLGALTREYQTRLAALNVEGFQKSSLEREIALNEEAYRLYQKKAQEAEINAVVQQASGVQVRLTEAPRSNPRPRNGPRHWLGFVLLGLLTSVGGVVVAESIHPRVRHADGLQRRFGLAVLAQLPAAPKAER
jgi:uncharacterized protein involved in exopolysaccharide biosynthesis